MTASDDDSAWRKRLHRREMRWLGSRLSQLEAGLLGAEVIDEFLNHPTLSLADQLRVVDAGLRRGLIQRADLHSDLVEPTPAAFGVKVPRRSKLLSEIQYGSGWLYCIPLILVWCVGACILTWLGGHPIVALLFGLFVGLFSTAMVALPLAILWCAGVELLPEAKSRRRFESALREHARKRRIQALVQRTSDIQYWYSASGAEFERLVARAFRDWDFHVVERGKTGDGGVDIVVTQDGKRAIVQCKAYAQPVGPAVVRELYGTMIAEGVSAAYLATLHGVTSAAEKWISDKHITVLTARHFIEQHHARYVAAA
jgi:hypothetical protein